MTEPNTIHHTKIVRYDKIVMYGNTYYFIYNDNYKNNKGTSSLKILKQKQLGRIATSLVSIFILRLNNHILDNKHIFVFTMSSFRND